MSHSPFDQVLKNFVEAHPAPKAVFPLPTAAGDVLPVALGPSPDEQTLKDFQYFFDKWMAGMGPPKAFLGRRQL